MPKLSLQAKRQRLILSLLVALVALAFTTRQFLRYGPLRTEPDEAGRDPLVQEFAVFGTYGRATFWAPPDVASAATDAVIAELQALHHMLNVFSPSSELSRLNATAANSPFACSDQLWAVLLECRRAYRETAGAFDITVGPLMKLWGFHRKRTSLPTDDEVAQALAAVGLDRVTFDDLRKTVQFSASETYFDLGGIAKGYALDRAVDIALGHGIRSGLIDLGGNIYCLPDPPPGRLAYSVGIRNPFHREALLGTVQILNCAVATSGNYERNVTLEGTTVHHIIDPTTGQSVSSAASVTVITPRGVDSDIYSTAVFVGGDRLVKSLRKGRHRTSVLRVDLSADGKPVVRADGWIWQGFDIEGQR